MPATFPSHQAVLPLKLWRPGWFDGVALAVGAASPDIAYLLDGSGLPVWPLSHQALGLVAWCLPVTVAISWLLRFLAPQVAVHLPGGGILALRDYGALHLARTGRHRWWVIASSAIIGAASHIVLDDLGDDTPVEWLFHLVGAAITVAVLVRVGQGRLIRRWHGDPPAVRRQPVLFWCVTGIVFLAGAALVPVLPAAFLPHTTGVRIIAAAAIALCCGALVVRGRNGPVAEAG